MPPWKVLAVVYSLFIEGKTKKQVQEFHKTLSTVEQRVERALDAEDDDDASVRDRSAVASMVADELADLFGDSLEDVRGGAQL